jgi:hypothetical protein
VDRAHPLQPVEAHILRTVSDEPRHERRRLRRRTKRPAIVAPPFDEHNPAATAMTTHESFSLVGGPLDQMGRRLGLVRGTNTVRLGLALGVGLWLVILALSVLEGVTARLFQLSAIGGSVRLLLAIPLFFICESWVGPRMTACVATITSTGIAPSGPLGTEVVRADRRAHAWWPEAAWLLIAIVLEVTATPLAKYGTTDVYDPARTALAALVYFRVGVTLFRFLLFLDVEASALELVSLARVTPESAPDSGTPRSRRRPRATRRGARAIHPVYRRALDPSMRLAGRIHLDANGRLERDRLSLDGDGAVDRRRPLHLPPACLHRQAVGSPHGGVWAVRQICGALRERVRGQMDRPRPSRGCVTARDSGHSVAG